MKPYRVSLGLPILLLIICAAVALSVIWDRVFTLYPTPDTESAFLKNYTPKSVIEHFEATDSSSYTRHSGGGAGRKFVTHSAGFDWHFEMRSENWLPLMTALRDDASAQLVGNGAQILIQSGNSRDGFHFEYKLGKSLGTLTISPLEKDSLIRRRAPLPEGVVDLTAHIEQNEMWFPKEPGTTQISINNSSP
jgi:hypothetical protein